MASKQMKTFVAALYDEQAKAPADQSVAEIREQYEAFGNMFPIAKGVTTADTMAGGVPAQWQTANTARDDRVLLYLHGGGYVSGSVSTHIGMTSRLSGAAKAKVLVLDYRLGPEHPFPAAVEDAVAAYGWLLEEGYEASRMAVAGDSAGGGLTVALLLALRAKSLPQPACAIPISPWTDLDGRGAWRDADPAGDPICDVAALSDFAADYMKDGDLHDPLASPVFGDLTGLPPLLIQVGSTEILLSDATRLADRAMGAGVDTTLEVEDGAPHVWHHAVPLLPEAMAAIDRIGTFVQHHTDD